MFMLELHNNKCWVCQFCYRFDEGGWGGGGGGNRKQPIHSKKRCSYSFHPGQAGGQQRSGGIPM